jgi:hypothetical protein
VATAASAVRPFEVTHRGVLAIALPMTLAYLSTPLLGAVNTAVIGRLGDAALLGGLAIGAIIFDAVFTTFNFLRSGTTGFTAQAYGALDGPELQAVFWRALILALVAGLIVVALHDAILAAAFAFMGGSEAVRGATATYYKIRVLATPLALANYVILGWLIGRGRALLALFLQSVLNGVNIILSVALVSGLGFGVAGVAWAAFAAETATAALGTVVVLRLLETSYRSDLARIVNLRAFRRMLAVNGDIMIRSFALLFAFAFFVSRSAAASDVVLAANQILITFFFVGSYFPGRTGDRCGTVCRPGDRSPLPAGLRAVARAGYRVGIRRRARIERVSVVWRIGDRGGDDDQRRRPRDGAALSAVCGADAGGRHARFPDGRRLHWRDLVARYAQHDASVGGHLSCHLVGAGSNSRHRRTMDRLAGLPRRSRIGASVDLFAPNCACVCR